MNLWKKPVLLLYVVYSVTYVFPVSFVLAVTQFRVATVGEKYLENEIFSRSGKSQGILWMAREI